MSEERDAYRVLQVDAAAHETVIRAAYRALAALYHPDRDESGGATRRMAELNDAYSKVRTRDRREAYDRLRSLTAGRPANAASQPVTVTPQPTTEHGRRHDQVQSGPEMIDFGRYAGWTIKQLAKHDPDYLRWLSRHTSGIRYRRVIEAALSAVAPAPTGHTTQEKRGRRR